MAFWNANKPKRSRGRKGWFKESEPHAVAAKIGWSYRKHGSDVRGINRYAASGTKRGKNKGLSITERSLNRYRKARTLSPARLEARRAWYTETKRKTTPRRTYTMAMTRAKKSWGTLYNRKGKRGASSYQQFVAKFIRGSRGPSGARSAMKRAAAAWRARGSRSNPVLPMSVQMNRKSGRKTRRNPVLPYMAYSNPLYRTSAGRFSKRGGVRKLRRISGGGWRNNAVLPYMAYSNPLAALTGTLEKLTDVNLWTGTILPLTGGFIATKIVAYQAVTLIAPKGTEFTGIIKHGATLGSAVLLSAGVGMVTKDTDMAAKVLGGGLVAFLGGLLDELLGADIKKLSGSEGVKGLADDLENELKARIAEGVRSQITGGPSGVEGMNSFVTQEALNRAPHMGDYVTQQTLHNATVHEGGPEQPGTQRPVNGLADLSTFQDAMMDGALI
jgi:hypothetical protein